MNIESNNINDNNNFVSTIQTTENESKHNEKINNLDIVNLNYLRKKSKQIKRIFDNEIDESNCEEYKNLIENDIGLTLVKITNFLKNGNFEGENDFSKLWSAFIKYDLHFSDEIDNIISEKNSEKIYLFDNFDDSDDSNDSDDSDESDYSNDVKIDKFDKTDNDDVSSNSSNDSVIQNRIRNKNRKKISIDKKRFKILHDIYIRKKIENEIRAFDKKWRQITFERDKNIDDIYSMYNTLDGVELLEYINDDISVICKDGKYMCTINFDNDKLMKYINKISLKLVNLFAEIHASCRPHHKLLYNSIPACVTHLTINEKYKHVPTIPNSVTHLTFGEYFNQEIIIPNGVTHLTFGKQYNQPTNLPHSITHLTFGDRYNQPTNIPNNIESLIFGYDFNYPITIPNSITNFEFGPIYQQSITFLCGMEKKICINKCNINFK